MESDPRSGSPRLLVLGGGPAQLGLLEAARARGLWIAVVDRDPAAPGFRLRRPPLHPLDRGRAGDRAARRRARRSTGSSRPARTGRSASPRGSPSGSACRTRSRRRRRCSRRTSCASASASPRRGIPQPRSWVVGGEDPLPAVSVPVVVKAPDRQGQKGLSLVESTRRRSCRRSRRRAAPPGAGSRSSRSSSTGRR